MQLLGLIALAAGVYVVGSVCITQVCVRRKSNAILLREKFPYSVNKISHRGGSILGPENTIYTFKHSVVEGHSDMLELDVRESKDGQIVVAHDQSLERICGEAFKGVNISDIEVGANPSQTLPQCLRVIPLEFKTREAAYYEATSVIPVDDTTRVCLLLEVFERVPDVPLHIDIKDAGKEFVTKVLDLIAEYKRESTTFVGSSVPANEAYIRGYFQEGRKERRKSYRIFPSIRGFMLVHLLYYTGLLPFVPLHFDVFSIPIFTGKMAEDARKEVGGVVASMASFLFVAPTLWLYLQSRGIAVVGWVLNDNADFEEAIKLPLNGLMSDDPIKLHNFIESHKCKWSLIPLGVTE